MLNDYSNDLKDIYEPFYSERSKIRDMKLPLSAIAVKLMFQNKENVCQSASFTLKAHHERSVTRTHLFRHNRRP